MKLNKKGYMMIELVLSSVLAMSIAIYLLNLTIQFKNKNEDIYQSIIYSADKIEVTKNIMNALENLTITDITKEENYIDLDVIEKNNTPSQRRLIITVADGITIEYGKWDDGFANKDVSYYKKKLSKSLTSQSPYYEIKNSDDSKFLSIKIFLNSMYSDDNYDINLLIKKTN